MPSSLLIKHGSPRHVNHCIKRDVQSHRASSFFFPFTNSDNVATFLSCSMFLFNTIYCFPVSFVLIPLGFFFHLRINMIPPENAGWVIQEWERRIVMLIHVSSAAA